MNPSLLRILISLLALVVIGTAVHSYLLYQNTLHLIAISNSFSKEYAVGNPHDPTLTYLVLGDSTAAGTGAQKLEETYAYAVAHALAAKGNYVHVINKAQVGAKVSDLISDQLPVLDSLTPDVLSISIGANDANHFTPAANYTTDYNTLVNHLSRLPSTTQVLLSNTLDMSLPPAYPLLYRWRAGNYSAQQNNISKEALHDNNRIKMINLFQDGRLDSTKDPSLYASDKFHPSPKGYALWASLFNAQLKS